MTFFTPDTFDVEELMRRAKKAEKEFAKLDQEAVVSTSEIIEYAMFVEGVLIFSVWNKLPFHTALLWCPHPTLAILYSTTVG